MRVIYACIILSALIPFALSAPDKPAKPEAKKIEPKKPAVPTLAVAGETNWGTLTQAGREIQIEGHPVWEAIGTIREDGKVQIIWTLSGTGRPCPGVYEIQKDGTLAGVWGYGHQVRINTVGQLEVIPESGANGSAIRSDVIIRPLPPDPAID